MGAVAMDVAQRQLAERLMAMRPKFVAQISLRLDLLEDLRDRFEANRADDAVRKELLYGAHKLAGVASMFGAHDLGEIARYAEVALEKNSEDALDLLDDLLGEMALIAEDEPKKYN